MNNPDRLYTLDALRGCAAILVVLYHLGDVTLPVAPGGYLAVDFFFALSGLVLGRAYAHRLRRGLTLGGFMLLRFIRLWPMFALGLGFAAVKSVGQIVAGDANALSPIQVGGALLTEVVLLPSPVTGADLFPLNGPAWSLFFELAINLAFAAWFVFLRGAWLRVIVIVAGAAVLVAALQHQTLNLGWSWSTSWVGLARVTFSFCVGMLVARDGVRVKTETWLMVLPVGGLVALMVLPIARDWRPLYDPVVALFLSPMALVVGAKLDAPKALQRACAALGDLSYPLYAIHFPLLFMAGFAARKMGLPPVLWVPAFVVALTTFAWWLGAQIDPIIRQWIAEKIGHRQLLLSPERAQARDTDRPSEAVVCSCNRLENRDS